MDWHRLLTLYGFDVKSRGDGALLVESVEFYYDEISESDYENSNPRFFRKILATLGLPDSYDEVAHVFDPPGEAFSEDAFLDAYYQNHRNASGGMPHDLSVLEPHIARLVRAINYIGITTTGSCEGHFLTRRDRRFFKPGYVACADCMQVTITLLNPNLKINQINEFVFPRGRDMGPEEAARAFWDELNNTAKMIENNQEKAREMVHAVKRSLDLRDEIIRAYKQG